MYMIIRREGMHLSFAAEASERAGENHTIRVSIKLAADVSGAQRGPGLPEAVGVE
jgi:hypothetical protein